MSRSSRRFATLLLDSEGLSKLVEKDPVAVHWVTLAQKLDARVLVAWVTLAEALQGPRTSATRYTLSRLVLEPHVERDFTTAADLMTTTAMGGHTVDAVLMAVASRLEKPVLIVTSDPGDLRQLAQGTTGVAVSHV